MESDERFKHLATDPRFKNLRKKQKKVEIDDRFKSMFKDEKFTLKYSQDKRGRKQKRKKGDDLKKYYSLKESETEEESESETSQSSSSDESESEDEEEIEVEDSESGVVLEPLDDDAETAEKTSRRLALQNLDWDRLDAADIYTLINSIRPPLSVKIYVSEFGKERLKDEELHGPKEIIEDVDDEEEDYRDIKQKLEAFKSKVGYEDADDELDCRNIEMREKIRKYQLNRMKYYYAVIEFDSVESAELVYRELDGNEYEGSSLMIDLRFVPDEIEFNNDDMKAECDKLPDMSSYKAPQFINSALQQTTVKFTWDETDVKRQEKLRKAFTKEELEKDDLEAYLASETDSDEEHDGDPVDQAEKYKELLQSLDDDADKKKKVELDVKWDDHIEDKQVDTGELDLLVMDADKERDDFEFNPEDDRFKAVYESGLYNIDPSHPNFKRTRAFDMMAEKKREKRQKTRVSR